jgi:hypothetical protein
MLQHRRMALIRVAFAFVLLLFVACGGSKETAAPAPTPAPAPAPYVGYSTTSGPTATLDGTTGPLNGNQYWLTTAATSLPRVGAFGEVSWTLDRPYGPFGQGVIMGLGEVRVVQVTPGPPGTTSQILLEVMQGHGGITFNGQAVNVVTEGKQVKLTYRL